MNRSIPSLLFGVLLAACSSGDPSADALARTDDAAGACPSGGKAIHTGHDRNGNGALDDDEIETTTLVCTTTTAKSLVVTENIAPGSECPAGGTRIRSGIDADGDGKLSPEETTQTEIACAPSTREAPVVSRVTAVDPGADCVAGGAKVESGPDRNGDGKLEDSEVTKTDFVCGRVLDQDLLIADAVTATRAADLVAITGKLTVKGAGLSAVQLGSLRLVGGEVRVEGTADLNELTLANLQRIGGTLTIDDAPSLRSVTLPALEQVAGVDVRALPALETIALPALRECAASLALDALPRLTDLALPSLAHVGGTLSLLRLGASSVASSVRTAGGFLLQAGSVQTLSLPQLASVEHAFAIDEPKIRAVDVPGLQRAPDQFAVTNAADLTTIAAQGLEVTGELDLWGDAKLTKISFPRLTEVKGTFLLRNVPSLGSLAGLSNLTKVDTLRIEGDVANLDPSTSALREAGWISLEGSNLTTFKLPALAHAERITIGDASGPNASLLTVGFPVLTDCDAFAVTDAPLLSSLSAPALRHVRDAVVLARTPALSTCDVKRLLNRLDATPGMVDVDGTQTASGCTTQ